MTDKIYKPNDFYKPLDFYVTKDGHTMTINDVAKDLNDFRRGFLEEKKTIESLTDKNTFLKQQLTEATASVKLRGELIDVTHKQMEKLEAQFNEVMGLAKKAVAQRDYVMDEMQKVLDLLKPVLDKVRKGNHPMTSAEIQLREAEKICREVLE